ncbi:hypothetical protein [Enterobacter hormaechei]|uniref:hypothetical protein n=1 Tax=Enterobacter hormaechei TaxID=158836 RepID=UPI0021BD3599|nr:hypothetical protein [Enterobacter hormaechei]
MSTITKEWLESQISAIKAVGITDSNTLQAFEIALASLQAEAAIHRWRRVTVEPYGPYPWHYGNFIGFSKPVDGIEDEYYYAAPPAPVSVPAAMEMDDDFDSAFEHGKAVGWNAYRAAMLQGAKPVTTAYKLRDAVETIRNSGIEIDAEKIFAERDALNAPDCWCRTCRPVTISDMRFVVCPECGNKRCPHANDHRNACTGSNEPGQEGSAYPAAPQQEVTQALAKGMERYGDAMQKLADSGD